MPEMSLGSSAYRWFSLILSAAPIDRIIHMLINMKFIAHPGGAVKQSKFNQSVLTSLLPIT